MQQNYRPQPSVIWARRVLALLVLGGLVWGAIAVVSGVFGFINGLIHPGQAPTQVAGADCQPQQLRVESHVGTSNSEYQGAFNPGENPYFWFSITNTGTVECKFNLGSSVTFYSVTSGSDNIWNSRDCLNVQRSDAVLTLKPSVTMAAPPTDWQRVRSSSSGCSIADGQSVVTANGASYVLHATVNGIISDNNSQFVLN